MIKLFNKTNLPDDVLKKVLSYAEKRMKVEGITVVKVTSLSRYFSKGTARRGWPYYWHLTKQRCPKNKRLTSPKSDYGWFEIGILNKAKGIEIETAESFLKTCLHEFAHIKDFRSYNHFPTERTPSGKRIKWAKRSIEISANNQVYDCQEKTKTELNKRDELILMLALEIEKAEEGK